MRTTVCTRRSFSQHLGMRLTFKMFNKINDVRQAEGQEQEDSKDDNNIQLIGKAKEKRKRRKRKRQKLIINLTTPAGL